MAGRPTDGSRDGRGGNKKISNRLVGLSAAAVLSVYSAGYVRTRSAAHELEQLETRRRAPAPAMAGASSPAQPPVQAPAPATTDEGAPRTSGPANGGASSAVVTQPEVLAPSPQPATPVAQTASSNPEANGTSTATATAAPSTAEADRTPPSVPAQAPVATPPTIAENIPPVAAADALSESTLAASLAPPASTPPIEAAPTTAPPANSSAPAAAAEGALKDGTYLGWGTSRHGDIQASVVIENGRIAKAVIAQCLTRYTCDIIDHLQKQVVDRQTPDVDVVGGATVSADAFYWAVVSALKKAK